MIAPAIEDNAAGPDDRHSLVNQDGRLVVLAGDERLCGLRPARPSTPG
jgi:hypothetical protein